MQQDFLTGAQSAELEQIEPGRGVHLRHHGSLNQGQTLRHRHGVTCIKHHLLGHTTTGEQAADAIAHLPGAAGTHFDNHPGALQAQRLAGTRWRRIEPGTLQQIGPVKPSGRHLHANLPCITGLRRLFQPLCTPFDALQCLHAASIVSETPAIDSMRLCAYRRVFAFCRPAPTEPAPYQTA